MDWIAMVYEATIKQYNAKNGNTEEEVKKTDIAEIKSSKVFAKMGLGMDKRKK